MLRKRKKIRATLLTLLMAMSVGVFAQEISISGAAVDSFGEGDKLL